jgi:hypothetical protein
MVAAQAQSRAMRIHKLLMALCMLAAFDAVTRAAESAAAPDLGFLVGHWCLEARGERIEEYWLPAAGDVMLGVGRTVKDGKTASFEFFRIEAKAGLTNYLAQPQGAPPTAFGLAAAGPGWARFENPRHDFPQRVEYRRTTTGLHAQIAGPGDGGKETVIAFDYRPCAGR